MDLHEYADEKIKLYESILGFVEGEEKEINQSQEQIVDIQKNVRNSDDFKLLLYFISKISENHHRNDFFIPKVEQIIQYFAKDMQQFLTNFQIFNLFKNNKRILLFLFQNKIIVPDQSIINLMEEEDTRKKNKYCLYFYPEIQNFLSKEKEQILKKKLLEINSSIFDDFDKKRLIGQNDSYICSLIQNDSIDEFIVYMNQTNLSLYETIIEPSIFETNYFLIKNEPASLIDYAAFYGSISIFNYLRLNGANLDKVTWIYAIHSNNPEIIHILERDRDRVPKRLFLLCFLESIKCHHNDIARYIQDNWLDLRKDVKNLTYDFKRNILSYSLGYYNFTFLPKQVENKYLFNYLCQYDYYELVKLFLIYNKYKINEKNKRKSIYDSEKDENAEIKNPIHLAAKKNNMKIVDLLLNQEDCYIGFRFFQNCRKITDITIPSQVKSIGNLAFDGCINLKQITIPSSVKFLSDNAFSGCISLTTITFEKPSSVFYIGCSCFEKCKSLSTIEIPSSVTSIKQNCFSFCTSLEEVTFELPSLIKTIEARSFMGCTSLKNISIPSSVKNIESFVFNECRSLVDMTIPSSVKFIGQHIFDKCTALKSLTILSSIPKIPSYFVNECSSLEEIKIPSSAKSIQENASASPRLRSIPARGYRDTGKYSGKI